MRAQLAIVSDVRLYREGLAQVLALDPEIEVATTGSTRPLQVILADAATLLRHGSLHQLAGSETDVAVVAFGIPERDDTAFFCARLGARGFVAAEDPLIDLTVAVHTVLRGEIYCSSRLTPLFVREATRLYVPDTISDPSLLTPREAEIAALLESGCSNKAIARQLGIEVTTVKTHVHHVLSKLQLHHRAEAAARAANRRRQLAVAPALIRKV